jgi:hypothetical protein
MLSSSTDVAGPLGTLAMSQVVVRSSTLALRTRTWQRDLDRLGVVVPFSFVHDLGIILATPPAHFEIAQRCDFATLVQDDHAAKRVQDYRSFLEAVAESVALRRRPPLSDASVVAALTKLLGRVAATLPVTRPYEVSLPNDALAYELTAMDLAALWSRVDRVFEDRSFRALLQRTLVVLAAVDALDLDALALADSLGGGLGASSLVDLIAALDDPATHDIVGFSLELLPSVLETRSRMGSSTHAALGYAGVGRRGPIDNLVLSELAWDDDEFFRRAADDELLFYTRDVALDETRRVHHLVIDASASMRGERALFARAVAIATAKKLTLAGEEVIIRFFDSRLYEPVRARGRDIPVAHILAFRGERGRNVARVLTSLTSEISLQRHRDHRDPVVHLFTHAASHVPRPVLESLRIQARIVAVFVAPRGGETKVDYLDLLDHHFVVSSSTLSQKENRTDAAKTILNAGEPTAPPKPAHPSRSPSP